MATRLFLPLSPLLPQGERGRKKAARPSRKHPTWPCAATPPRKRGGVAAGSLPPPSTFAQPSMIPTNASSPSVSAAGPGCRIGGRDPGGHELLAAPRADDDVWRGRDHVGGLHDAI